jgi:hypothetical protein
MTYTAAEFLDLIRTQAFGTVAPAPKPVEVPCYQCAGTGCCDLGPEPALCARCGGHGYTLEEAK